MPLRPWEHRGCFETQLAFSLLLLLFDHLPAVAMSSPLIFFAGLLYLSWTTTVQTFPLPPDVNQLQPTVRTESSNVSSCRAYVIFILIIYRVRSCNNLIFLRDG